MNMDKYYFTMQGEVFESAMPLHIAVEGLGSMQAILDKSYLASVGKKRMSKRDRESFYLQTREIRHGSLMAELEIVVETAAYLFPAMIGAEQARIWDLTKQSFDYLKLMFSAFGRGEQPEIHIEDSQNVTVVNGDTSYTFNGPVNVIAQSALPHYQSLTKLLGNGVESIDLTGELNDSTVQAFSLTSGDENLFDPRLTVENQPIELECNIFDFNKQTLYGKLAVPEGQPIGEGKYGFHVVGDASTSEVIHSMLHERIRISCIQELLIDPINDRGVDKIRILDVL